MMTNYKRTIEIEVLCESNEEITYSELDKRIRENVPEEYLDNVRIETDKHGYIEVTYTRYETDEEFNKRIELEKSRERVQHLNIIVNIANQYGIKLDREEAERKILHGI